MPSAQTTQAPLDAYDLLDEPTRKVTRHIAARKYISRNLAEDPDAEPSAGQRASDAVASFGGSWTFVGLFVAVLLGWIALNGVLLLSRGATFDPYPYILLSLFLSMLAAIQAPVILMSQSRQSEKGRLNAEHNYEVNLKAELEIMLLHENIDSLREQRWAELLVMQRRQIDLLNALAVKHAI